MRKNGLVKKDACDQTKWRGEVKTMTIPKSSQLRRRGQYRIEHVMMLNI